MWRAIVENNGDFFLFWTFLTPSNARVKLYFRLLDIWKNAFKRVLLRIIITVKKHAICTLYMHTTIWYFSNSNIQYIQYNNINCLSLSDIVIYFCFLLNSIILFFLWEMDDKFINIWIVFNQSEKLFRMEAGQLQKRYFLSCPTTKRGVGHYSGARIFSLTPLKRTFHLHFFYLTRTSKEGHCGWTATFLFCFPFFAKWNKTFLQRLLSNSIHLIVLAYWLVAELS